MSARSLRSKLAIDGGKPVSRKPFPPWPSLSKESIRRAVEPLRSGKVNYWTGEVGMQFEETFAKWCGLKNGISTTNGTSALHTAVASLGIGPGDEVICPSYSFIASSFCVLQAGALPVFADADESHTLAPADIENKITERTRAILVVHLYGIVADMEPILEIARRHNLKVIEDCAQCFGGLYKGKKAGAVGDVGCFSFCQSKHFTTGGEGGMVVTSDEDLAWECRSFRDHGYDVKERLRLLEMEAKLMYIHRRVGFNYRMTEMQSQIGLCELERFDSWNLPNRQRNGRYLIEALKGHPLVLHPPLDTPERVNSFWWAPFVVDSDRLTVPTKQFIAAIGAEGVPVYGVLWPEMYRERAYVEQNGFGAAKYPFRDPKARPIDYSQVNCPKAKWLSDRTVSFFAHPVYEEKHMQKCVDAFEKVAEHYMR
ncbi:MAG: DegT/DnrJ/EryC1/StrS family aminotransferase [Candidatus Sumerlaeota bacterium]|nr:DegT/DnrJ/EryC1/StrS family aminotransferase [Candidatus Sumerlaeota bacterium]